MTYTTVWQYTETQMTELANQAKEQIIFALANEGLLKGDPEEIARTYVIVLHGKGYFGRLWDRWRGTDKEGLFFAVLKSVSGGVASDDGEEEKVPHLKVVPLPKKKDV
jgi:hypothetical protein